jgi:hypothetical protein
MGGYQRSTLKLVFADPELAGLEVKARRLTVRELLELSKMRTVDPDNVDAMEHLLHTATVMSGVLLAWNLADDDGNPVPLSADTLADQDPDLLTAIIGAVTAASVGVSPPLPQPSADGVPSPELSLPMEISSPSPGTSSKPD